MPDMTMPQISATPAPAKAARDTVRSADAKTESASEQDFSKVLDAQRPAEKDAAESAAATEQRAEQGADKPDEASAAEVATAAEALAARALADGWMVELLAAPDGLDWNDVLVVQGGINFYGLARRDMWNRIGAYVAVPRAERIMLTEMALHGTFGVLPADLYFRRIHDGQITALRRDRRKEALVLDPDRASGPRGTVGLIVAEYFLGYVAAILRAPLPITARIRTLRALLRWFLRGVPAR